MFMNKVMLKIWEPLYYKYKKRYNEVNKKSIERIYDDIKNKKMNFYQYPGLNMNLVLTSGCSYKINSKGISGCSMCDYESSNHECHILMNVLRKKSKSKYSEMVLKSFENVRGKSPQPNFIELISGHDCFDSFEYPKNIYDKIFKSKKFFNKRPFEYIFEVKASSVTKDKVRKLKSYLGDRNRCTIGFGVEVGNEWIRKYWLNKKISNSHIINAVELIHSEGFKVKVYVLLGIPGLTEEHSMNLFIKTIQWLKSLNVDSYIILPLNNKKNTLQGFISKNLSANNRLKTLGIAQDEHTCIPWLFTILKSLIKVLDLFPELTNKLNIAQFRSTQNTVKNQLAYNIKGCECNEIILNALEKYQLDKKKEILINTYNKLINDKCLMEYSKLLNIQSKSNDLKKNMHTVGLEVAKKCWPIIYNKKMKIFEKELKKFNNSSCPII